MGDNHKYDDCMVTFRHLITTLINGTKAISATWVLLRSRKLAGFEDLTKKS